MTEQMTESAPDTGAQAEAPKWAPETETEARALGWKAPDEWKGEIPSGYIDDPNRYLERAESFAPFRKIKEQSEERFRKLEAVTAKQVERERLAHQAELAKIKGDKIAAVEVGDVDAYKALEKREEAVRNQIPDDAPKPSGVPENHRSAIEQWSVGKPWFKTDPVMTNAATVLYGMAEKEGLTDPKAMLAYVDREMATKFASLAPKAPAIEAVEGGLTFGSGSIASPFEKLPKDAKDAFRRFVDKGVFKDTKEDRAQYAEDYNAG
jgi:hypothetical protein